MFLCKNGEVKLGDLNVSKIAKQGLLYTQTGTPYYASPEVWQDKPYDAKSDIWSLGCVLYESIMLKPPFLASSMDGLYKKVCKGEYPKISVQYSAELAYLIKLLLKVSPTDRPSCAQILKTTIIKNKLNGNEDDVVVPIEDLLGTIKVPYNMQLVKLPKPNYEKENKKPSKHKTDSYYEQRGEELMSHFRSKKSIEGPSPKTNENVRLPQIVCYKCESKRASISKAAERQRLMPASEAEPRMPPQIKHVDSLNSRTHTNLTNIEDHISSIVHKNKKDRADPSYLRPTWWG